MVTKGIDRCLFAFPPEEWAAFKANIKANADLGEGPPALADVLLDGLRGDVGPAGAGIDSHEARAVRGLQRDVTITGVDDRLEIWATEEWDRYVTDADESFAEIVEEFAGRDLGA